MVKITQKCKLPVAQLTARQPRNTLGFRTTASLKPRTGILGQERATTALQFGVAMQRSGYNIYVMGESGTGRMSYVRHYLEGEAKRMPSPPDYAYVNNFDNPREPKVLALPAGFCNELVSDINELLDSILATFPTTFESPTYQQKKSLIERDFNKRYDHAIDAVEQEAVKRNIALFRETGSLSFTPMAKGKAMDETEFARLPDKKREKFNSDITELETLLNNSLVEMPQWKRESNDQLRKLNQETIDQAIEPLLKPLHKKYKKQKDVVEYLKEAKQHLHRIVIEHLTDDRGLDPREDASKRQLMIDNYLPNPVVANKKKGAVPVVFESHPNYKNLFGRIEYASEMGALVTNYRQICAGSLHKANGGYLVIEAAKLLEEPFVWEALKRALKEKELKIESPYSELGLLNTTTLTPENIPLDVKIILVGSREIYYILQQLDPDFHEMFRVLVDFEGYIPRTPDNVQAFARLLKCRAEDEGYPPLTAGAVARMVEQSSRKAEHQKHLSAHIGDLFDLLSESDFIRRMNKGDKIEEKHIDQALEAKAERTSRVSRQILDEIIEGTVLIDTDGDAIGKINGLTVLTIGDTSFGSPARITAAVHPGSQGIVDIERESTLGQAIHSKGIMILSGFLGSTYAQRFPLAISASLAMEQSYGYIDGDSASVAELCCLISALTNTPINQGFSVTGSMNQHGEVQAIGGVNEKIEGFFALCEARGLTGKQGVIIPASNVNNLMLSQKVIDSCRKKKFHIYAIEHVEEALTLLTGQEPGKADKKGEYPEGTVNRKVVDRLREIAEMAKDSSD